MKAWVARKGDGLWHIHCGRCATASPREGCVGRYSNREAAMSNATAHMRSEHCGEH